MRFARVCLILACLAPVSPGRGEAVTWMVSDPAYADTKETMSSGQLAFLTGHLTGFSHHTVKVSASRAVHELQHGAGVCTTDVLVTPERERYLVFAKRRMELPGFRLMIRKDRLGALAPAVDGRGNVDLAKLQEIPNLSGDYTNARHYGPAISEFIQRRGSDGLDGEVATFQLFNLLAAGRIDFAFVMPMDFYFYLSEEQRQQTTLLPVVDETPATAVTVACSADPTGHAVIHAINTLLADDAHWADYIEPLRKWTSPEDFEAMRVSHSNVNGVP